MAKETIVKCDCCKIEIFGGKHKTTTDIINTGSHVSFTEQLFRSEFRNELNTQIYEMKELCDECCKHIEQGLRDVLVATVKNINYKEPESEH